MRASSSLERERLREIVVRARLESAHAVVDGVARGEHENRSLDAVLARVSADVEPVATRQHDVEYDDIELSERDRLARGCRVSRVARLDERLAQSLQEDSRELRVIFDEKYAHG